MPPQRMKLYSLSYDDYSAFSYENCEAMKSVGINAESICMLQHTFKYKEHSRIGTSWSEVAKEIGDADIIIIQHSTEIALSIVTKLTNCKRIIHFATGTKYRQEPERLNALFNPVVEKSLYALTEFEKLGLKNAEFVSMTINTDKYIPDFTRKEKITIAHFPSNEDTKGTAEILKVIAELKVKYPNKFEFICSTNKVTHAQQIERVKQCDVYVEMLNTHQDGKDYCSFGTSALEAAALGKIVVTNFCFDKPYKEVYGLPALRVANTPDAMFNQLQFLICCDENLLLSLKQKARLWVEKCHSYKATGERMKKVLGL